MLYQLISIRAAPSQRLFYKRECSEELLRCFSTRRTVLLEEPSNRGALSLSSITQKVKTIFLEKKREGGGAVLLKESVNYSIYDNFFLFYFAEYGE